MSIPTATPQASEHRPGARRKDAEGSDFGDDGLLVSAVPLWDRTSLQHARQRLERMRKGAALDRTQEFLMSMAFLNSSFPTAMA